MCSLDKTIVHHTKSPSCTAKIADNFICNAEQCFANQKKQLLKRVLVYIVFAKCVGLMAEITSNKYNF